MSVVRVSVDVGTGHLANAGVAGQDIHVQVSEVGVSVYVWALGTWQMLA